MFSSDTEKLIKLQNLEHNTFREVFHIWYLWPVSGVQSDGAGLIAVLLEARALQRGGPGPIVVHCSPGTGRTGTLIALDLGIRQYEITRTVDVPRVVYTIRRDRAGAVQTKEQYAFIYKVIVHVRFYLRWLQLARERKLELWSIAIVSIKVNHEVIAC
ncbi:receptor-type tyrosine-protein phosphatase zeta [Lasius niger]|uniref:protein-tyrosine-phosphatase n=1 Tax=Lasius niger TaxID=67767 RepID=A0A0J7KTX5_LASNI|nr:receptor-type tyrosine-protein phosphatase zeta [Lasius niger]